MPVYSTFPVYNATSVFSVLYHVSVPFQCIVPHQFSVYSARPVHSTIPVYSATSVCQCTVPFQCIVTLQCTISICQCTVPFQCIVTLQCTIPILIHSAIPVYSDSWCHPHLLYHHHLPYLKPLHHEAKTNWVYADESYCLNCVKSWVDCKVKCIYENMVSEWTDITDKFITFRPISFLLFTFPFHLYISWNSFLIYSRAQFLCSFQLLMWLLLLMPCLLIGPFSFKGLVYHYWLVDLGQVLCIGFILTCRSFRPSPWCCTEWLSTYLVSI